MSISTIADFYRISEERDFARDNQLRVLAISTGAGIQTDISQEDLVYAKTSTLPTRNIQMGQATFMGLDFNIPGNVKYDGSGSYTITFWADQKLDLWNKMQQWTREVFDDATSTGNYLVPKASSRITLASVDNNLEVVNTYNLIGVTPVSVGTLSYDISNSGQVQTFDLNIAYHFWTPEA